MTVEELAFSKWVEAGRPEGRSEEFWYAAEYDIQKADAIDPELNELVDDVTEADDEEIDRLLVRIVSKGLRDCIIAHGPIRKKFIGSAVKRVISGIVESPRFRELCPDNLYRNLILDSIKYYYNQKFYHYWRRYDILNRQIEHQKAKHVKKLAEKDILINNLRSENQDHRKVLSHVVLENQKLRLLLKEQGYGHEATRRVTEQLCQSGVQ